METALEFPLKMTFKVLAFGPQISVRDAGDREILYVHQKLFKLKEEINLFSDHTRSQQLYGIKADRVFDWSARYRFTDQAGSELGSVKRHGTRSLWRASYDVLDGERIEFQIQEANPWVKLADSLLGELPIIGMFTGYFLHPVYLVTRGEQAGGAVLRMTKKPSFLERNYYLERVGAGLTPDEEERLLLSLLLVTLLERARG